MAYTRVNWENLPSTKTPVNADNLNKMEEIYVGKEEPVAGEKVWFRKGKNLFDKSKALLGYWIGNEQGDVIKAPNDVFVTDFIPVFKDVPVYIPATGSERREFYNKNKVGITYLNNAGAQVFTPTEDGFIRVTCNMNTITMDSLMINYGTTETEYEAYIEPQIFVNNSNGVYEGIVNAVEKSDLLNLIYPVGSIYMSVNSTNPASLFGGTWEQIKDKFLLSAGNTYSAGKTGGEATHKLTQNEIPNYLIGNIPTIVPINHKNWNNNGISGVDVGQMATTKEGVNSSTYNDNTSGMQYGWRILTNGGGQAHNNMPPYLAVFVWKRTA